MSQVAIVRENGILPFKAAIDLTGHEGQPVEVTNTDEVTLLTTGGDRPFGILLKGGKAGENVSVAIPGALAGTVRLKLGESIHNVGTLLEISEHPAGGECIFVPNSGGGGNYTMGVAMETGVTGEKIEAVLIPPREIV